MPSQPVASACAHRSATVSSPGRIRPEAEFHGDSPPLRESGSRDDLSPPGSAPRLGVVLGRARRGPVKRSSSSRRSVCSSNRSNRRTSTPSTRSGPIRTCADICGTTSSSRALLPRRSSHERGRLPRAGLRFLVALLARIRAGHRLLRIRLFQDSDVPSSCTASSRVSGGGDW